MKHRRAPPWASELESLAAAQRANVSATHRGVDCPRRLSGRNRPFHRRDRDTPETWEYGLMERASLAPNAGMLFIFPDVAPRAFWMMNTSSHSICSLSMRAAASSTSRKMLCRGPPRRCPTYSSTAPAKYVLEIPGGRARALGMNAGDKIHF